MAGPDSDQNSETSEPEASSNTLETREDQEDQEDQRSSRRVFLQAAGAGLGAAALGRMPRFQTPDGPVKVIPEAKNYSRAWLQSLTYDPHPRVMEGAELKYIGMPVGGIGCGQVNLGGDGRLWLWDIFNHIKFGVVDKTVVFRKSTLNAGSGANYVEPPEQVHPFHSGFGIRYGSGLAQAKSLRFGQWESIQFRGEYPMGFVEYEDPECPLKISLEAYSPFVPLATERSTRPCVMMRLTVENQGSEEQDVEVSGWLENVIGRQTTKETGPVRRAQLHRSADAASLVFEIQSAEPPARPAVMFDDFEKPSYEGWTVEGEAFGPGPIEITEMPRYQGVVGGLGRRIVCSHNARDGRNVVQADSLTGRLISRDFKIERRYITFLAAGGKHPGKTCMNLVVGGKTVRTATGHDSNALWDECFDVGEFEGQTGHLEIVDEETGGWGNISVDHIVFTDLWPDQGVLNRRSDVGHMAVSYLGGSDEAAMAPADQALMMAFLGSGQDVPSDPTNRPDISSLAVTAKVPAGGKKVFPFMLSWTFPNLEVPLLGKVGNGSSTRHSDLAALAQDMAKRDGEYEPTKQWHDVWYDSTLPRWFLDRVMGNTCTLATMTSTIFNNGRFYGWEGIGCCVGTCGHVYQYAQAMARLFPDLERSVREMVDFGVAFHPDTGIIDFRGEYGEGYAVDSQAGYVLRAYREHQMSEDSKFLKRLWPRVKKALQYMIVQDGNESGILRNRQHNTLDVDMYGPSSWLSSLYLAALLAGKAMAEEMNDPEFRDQCQTILKNGYSNMSKELWNGEYFISKPAPGHPDSLMYGDGCEVDQVMGQGWCWQVGLKDRLFDRDQTLKALGAIYKYNLLPDVGPFRDKFKPGRWYALPGEGGLVICTFPKGDRNQILGGSPTWASMYFDECMTGFEYEVAGHMLAEGMTDEGMAIVKTVHERYDPRRRNPWNEVECSDHYARCMAVYGVFITACGFEHHGPKGHIAFAPRITPGSFRCPFTACSGWGTYTQSQKGDSMTFSILVKYGNLRLKTWGITVREGLEGQSVTVTLDGKPVSARPVWDGRQAVIQFDHEVTSTEGSLLEATLVKESQG